MDTKIGYSRRGGEMTESEKDMLLAGSHAAELVGVSTPTFYKMSKEEPGLAPAASMSQNIVWSLSAIIRWLEERDWKEFVRRETLVASWTEAGDDGP